MPQDATDLSPAADPSASLEPSEGRRHPLSRDLIVTAAIALADHDGLATLTMRRLGQSLGVEAMSLYRHVNGREDLLEGMTERLVAQVRRDNPGDAGPLDGWQAYLQRFAHAVRAVAIDHPLVFPLIATRHPAAPWLRPPLRSVAVVEDFLDALTARGLTDRQAVDVYRSFTSFLLGHLLLETAMMGASTAPVEEPLNEGDAPVPTGDDGLDLASYPTVLRLRATLSVDHSSIEFEQGLEALLDRLDLHLSQ
jgi:TetR/AcrR family tetracycline transcriptional repressor